MFSYLLAQSPQLPFIPIVIVIALIVFVLIFALTGRLQFFWSWVRSQKFGKQEDVLEQREQLETALYQLEQALREQEETQEQLAEALKEQEETQEQLVATRKQLEETSTQLAEVQKQLALAQNELRKARKPDGQDKPPVDDNLLNNRAWIKLAQECVGLFDELTKKSANMDPGRQELAGYVCSQVEEILERCGITVISGDSSFDENRHRPYPAVSRVAAGTVIAQTLSPGFVVGSRVLRRAQVRLAE